MKTKIYISLAIIAFLTSYSWSFAFWWIEKVSDWLKWSWDTADIAIQWLVSKAMWFLWILAVLYAIYWGFLILTASWDDSKVKKWKSILMQALLWLLIIFLSYSIVSWLLTSIFWGWNAA